MNRQRVHAGFKLGGERRVDHAVAFEAGLPSEGVRHDIHSEMRLPARPMSGMAFVVMRLVHHAHARRMESLGQLSCDLFSNAHAARLAAVMRAGQSRRPRRVRNEACVKSCGAQGCVRIMPR